MGGQGGAGRRFEGGGRCLMCGPSKLRPALTMREVAGVDSVRAEIPSTQPGAWTAVTSRLRADLGFIFSGFVWRVLTTRLLI